MSTTKHRRTGGAAAPAARAATRALLCALLVAALAPARAQIAIHTTRNLEFGKFVAGAGGTVSVDTNGARSRSGGVVLMSSSSASASFTVSDSNPANIGKVYLITLPDNGTTTLSNGATTMALSNFTSAPNLTGLLTGGTQVLQVGATLAVGANQPPGSYAGTFVVTVEYQ